MYRFFTYRIYPSATQARCMEGILETCRVFYNLLAQERLAAHRAGQRLGLAAQFRRVATYRKENPAAREAHSHTLQLCCEAVNLAWKCFMKRGFRGKGPRLRAPGAFRVVGHAGV